MARTRKEKWEYPSLEWIHRVREEIYREERGVPLSRLVPKTSPDVLDLVRRLHLRIVRAGKAGRLRRRTG